MQFMPFQVLGIWLRGFLALLLLGAGVYLLSRWYDERTEFVAAAGATERADTGSQVESSTPTAASRQSPDRENEFRRVDWRFGLNRETAYLLGGLALIIWSLGGRFLSPTHWRKRGKDEPTDSLPGTVQRLKRPDGSELCVESYGRQDGTPLILTHGWGLDSQEWYYAKKELGNHFRLVAWDLPGLGRSTRPANNDWSLEKLAGDLEAVLTVAGDRPAVLVGHSIGGMIMLTFCRLFPEALNHRVCGLVIAHSTFTNPVKTTSMPGLHTALQKSVLEPLCHLMVALAPLAWLLNWLGYLNGSAHRATERSSFSGHETKGQLDFLARYNVRAWPAVVARGFLAMFRYDETATLASVNVPTLIVAGDKDTTCTPEASLQMSEAISDSSLVTLKDARHCGLFEHHDQFLVRVRDFAAKLGREALAGSTR